MKHADLFVMIYLPNQRMLGTIYQKPYDNFLAGNIQPLRVVYPKLYAEVPRDGGAALLIQPLHSDKSAQEQIRVLPTALEIICKVGEQGPELWTQYQDSVQRWKAYCSGLVMPNQKGLEIGSAQNPLQAKHFPRNR